MFEKDYKSSLEFFDDDSSDSEGENESKESFYSPNDSKASDSFSLKSCIPASSEGKKR